LAHSWGTFVASPPVGSQPLDSDAAVGGAGPERGARPRAGDACHSTAQDEQLSWFLFTASVLVELVEGHHLGCSITKNA